MMMEAAGSPRVDLTTPNLQEMCKLTGTTRPAPKKLRSMRWLHFPKCGTSFGTALMHYACPAIPEDSYPHKIAGVSEYMLVFKRHYLRPQYCDSEISVGSISGHTPLNKTLQQNPDSVVAMFRDPRRRDYSGWLVHGDMGTRRHPEDLIEYVRMHRACQGRMVLGLHCESKRKAPLYFEATGKQKAQAVATVENMAFVGLTDYWHESICLFHAMFGGRITKHEMDNVRPGIIDELGENPAPVWEKEVPKEEDPLDWELFQTAKRIFVTRLVQYGIQVPPDLKK